MRKPPYVLYFSLVDQSVLKELELYCWMVSIDKINDRILETISYSKHSLISLDNGSTYHSVNSLSLVTYVCSSFRRHTPP
jgi:hypothetical protein